jgi:hypothetical protein
VINASTAARSFVVDTIVDDAAPGVPTPRRASARPCKAQWDDGDPVEPPGDANRRQPGSAQRTFRPLTRSSFIIVGSFSRVAALASLVHSDFMSAMTSRRR